MMRTVCCSGRQAPPPLDPPLNLAATTLRTVMNGGSNEKSSLLPSTRRMGAEEVKIERRDEGIYVCTFNLEEFCQEPVSCVVQHREKSLKNTWSFPCHVVK